MHVCLRLLCQLSSSISAGGTVRACLDNLPSLSMDAQLQPITRTVLRIQLTLQPTFTWSDKVHGGSMRWLIW